MLKPELAATTEAPTPSMLEEIRRTAESRLRELEPLLEEAERLRDVLAALERGSPRRGPATGRAPSGDARDERTVAPRAAKGANKRTILDLVGRRPGITVAEIATVTGMKRTVVASTVSRLKRQGHLHDHARGGVCVNQPARARSGRPVGEGTLVRVQ